MGDPVITFCDECGMSSVREHRYTCSKRDTVRFKPLPDRRSPDNRAAATMLGTVVPLRSVVCECGTPMIEHGVTDCPYHTRPKRRATSMVQP